MEGEGLLQLGVFSQLWQHILWIYFLSLPPTGKFCDSSLSFVKPSFGWKVIHQACITVNILIYNIDTVLLKCVVFPS